MPNPCFSVYLKLSNKTSIPSTLARGLINNSFIFYDVTKINERDDIVIKRNIFMKYFIVNGFLTSFISANYI